jgi:sigma-54 specific flagellar transcriptional regulator A
MNCLARNRWPGNVRELANLLERLAILFPEQTITASDLPERYRSSGAPRWFTGGARLAPVASPALVDALLEAGDMDPLRAVPMASLADEDGLDEEDGEEDSDAGESVFVRAAEISGIELPRGGIDLKDHLSAIEVGLIRKALEEADGTVAEAARLLRMRRTTLVEKLRKYRLSA